MFESVAIGLLLLASFFLHYRVVARGRLILGPETVFLIMGAATYGATLVTASRVTGSMSHPYADFIGAGLVSFVLGAVLARFVLRSRHLAEVQAFCRKPWRDDLRELDFLLVIGIGAFSALMTAGYFYQLGVFAPVQALRALATADLDTVSMIYNEARRTTRTVRGFLGPGYVFQFKNCLLPLVAMICFFEMRLRPSLSRRILFFVFLSLAVIGTIGTGARFYFAFFALSFLLIGFSVLMEPFQFRRHHLAIAIVGAASLLTVMTLLMGTRGQDKIVDVPVLWAPLQVIDRAVTAPAEERFLVYELFMANRPPMAGQGIAEQLAILLPGKADDALSSRLHEMLYGSATGNVGLDVWGTLWYEFHWVGLLAAFGLGFLYHAYYVWILRGPKRFIRLVTLLFAGLLLGFATDLQVLILRGFLSCMILLALIGFARLLHFVAKRGPLTNDP